jgi:hypothetical protein
VYNKEENGRMKLVALEYAVPIDLSTNAPSGFTGNGDAWSVYQGVLWTLHAWIWEYNPDGVFNPTNLFDTCALKFGCIGLMGDCKSLTTSNSSGS